MKPAARRLFWVFKDDILPDLAELKGIDNKPMRAFDLFALLEYEKGGPDTPKIVPLLKRALLFTFKTDFNGEATVKLPIRTEPYYIFGYITIGESVRGMVRAGHRWKNVSDHF